MPAVIAAILSALTNPIGYISAALIVGWVSGWWWESNRWTDAVAKEKAAIEYAHQVEIARQQQAAREIAEDATNRLVEELAAEAAMRKEIDELKRSEADAKDCLVDDDFLRRLRRIEEAGRKASPARRTR